MAESSFVAQTRWIATAKTTTNMLLISIYSIDRQNSMLTQSLKKQKTYQIGDIVGVKIAKVDRSNTAPSILPCKIVRIQSKRDNHMNSYYLATRDGIISNAFTSTDLIDLTRTTSAELRDIDTTNLPQISIIQASHTYTKFRTINACKCSKSCESGRCPCKKRNIPCCSKCHSGKKLSCSNIDWIFSASSDHGNSLTIPLQ